MSLKSFEARKLAAASVAALALFGASASAADAAKLTLTYQCTYPLIGEAPLKIDIDAAIPTSTPKGVATPEFQINAVATASGNTYTGISLIGAKKLEGSAIAKSTVALPGGVNLPVAVPITVASYDVPATAGDLVLNASGKTPSLTFPTAGSAKITVDSLALSLKALKADGTAVVFPGAGEDSDKNPDTFDVSCRLDPAGQDTTLASISITDGGVVTPPATTPPVVTSPVTTPPVVTPPATTPPVVTPPTTTYVNYGYNLAGSATLKTLVRGTLPLTGSIDAKLALQTGDFTADLKLNQSSAKLTALGILPVVAKVAITQTQPVTGSLKDGVLSANAKVRIKIPSVTLLGIPLGGGGSCQAKSPSNISLRSTDKFFAPLDGGTLVGNFSISELTGCGFLNGIISPLTAGSGNAIALKLTPKS